MVNYHALETAAFKDLNIDTYSSNRPELVHLEDDAHTVLWDFHKTCPNFGGLKQNADHALEEMNSLGAHWLIILDEQHNQAGILSSQDVLGRKAMQVVKQCNMTREKLICKMLMTEIADIPCMDATLLKHAKVGHIVETLKEAKSDYLLVSEKRDGKDHLCGLFTKLGISEQLHQSVF